jgi:hypothetical protein
MSRQFASGAHAFGFCDRCGFRFGLAELLWEISDKKRNGLRVCEPCLDPDHPQLQLGRVKVNDPQTLRDPRPDNSRIDSTSFFGWRPVGDNIALGLTASIGSVTVTTS